MFQPTEVPRPCVPSPCGSNAICKEKNGAGSCACLPEYYGDPYSFCKPECMVNSDCDRSKACFNQKCTDPCPGVCGNNAECHVVNHSPSCVCLPGFSGNPLTGCREPPKSIFCVELSKRDYNLSFYCSIEEYLPPIDLCHPSPCGPYSECKPSNGHAICSCIITYIGSPPACRPECVVSSDCRQSKACRNQKCIDPCPGTCGINAECQVINHSPICSCLPNFVGDPFIRCFKEDSKNKAKPKQTFKPQLKKYLSF